MEVRPEDVVNQPLEVVADVAERHGWSAAVGRPRPAGLLQEPEAVAVGVEGEVAQRIRAGGIGPAHRVAVTVNAGAEDAFAGAKALDEFVADPAAVGRLVSREHARDAGVSEPLAEESLERGVARALHALEDRVVE